HDGDRVVKFSPDGKMKKWQYRVDDKYLFELIEDLESSDSGKRQRARIYNQPGAYGCSTPELDFIVDLVKQIPKVKGAKLTGAGLGGCILILVEKESAEEVVEIVNEKYYRARDLPEVAFICNSVEGAKFV
ncbi:galactokinase, partial [Thermococci archaeon]